MSVKEGWVRGKSVRASAHEKFNKISRVLWISPAPVVFFLLFIALLTNARGTRG